MSSGSLAASSLSKHFILSKSGTFDNLKVFTLHLAFANHDLIQDLPSVATKKQIDGVPVKTLGHEALLLAQMNQKKRYQDNQAILKKGIAVYLK